MTTAAASVASRADLLRRGIRREYLTVGWNVVEGIMAIRAGIAAGSVALIGFGVHSFEAFRGEEDQGRERLTR